MLLFLLPIGMRGQELSVAERNAQLGFNDTIDRMAEDFVTVSLVIAEPGDILYSAFGHAMLHLQCPTFGLDYIFSYESEPIQESWGRFLMGNLKMGMFAIPLDTMLRPYREEGRWVVEYPLNLSPAQEQDLWRIMDEMAAVGPNQPYDYYNHGCALSVVHVVKQAIGEQQIQYRNWPARFDGSMRELGYECVTNSNHLWNRFALMTLAGSDIDNPHIAKEKKLIVPADLVEVWQQATFVTGKPVLDSQAHVLVAPTKQPKAGWCSPLLVSLVLCLFALLSFATFGTQAPVLRIVGRVVDYALLLLITFIGAIVTYTVVFSTLPCTDWNWLILVFNPLPAILWYWRKYWALPYAVLIVVWCVAMLCAPHRLVEYAHLVLALSFALVLLKQSPIVVQFLTNHASFRRL